MDLDVGGRTGVHAWKYWLIAGIGCFLIAIWILRNSLRGELEANWTSEHNTFNIFWGLFFAVISIIFYGGMYGVDKRISLELNVVLTAQVAIFLFWAMYMDIEDPRGLVSMQLLLCANIIWVMWIFWKRSMFGFWISALYLIVVLVSIYRLHNKIESGEIM